MGFLVLREMMVDKPPSLHLVPCSKSAVLCLCVMLDSDVLDMLSNSSLASYCAFVKQG